MEQSTATVEELTPVRKRLQVEVPAHAVQAELDRTFHEVGQRARLRGFRPPPARYATGVFAKYASQVSSAAEGAVTSPASQRAVPTPE